MKRSPAFAQHFLTDPWLVKTLLGHAAIAKHDVVYDIGAGSGVITSVLAGAAQKVVAVELDPRLAAKLRQNAGALKNVTVQEADATKITLPRTPYKVFANIPFHLSSQIVQHFCGAHNPPSAMYLIVQEQFARKLLPDNKGFTNQLALQLGPAFAVRIRRKLQPADFYPRPNVPTVFIEIIHRPTPLLTKPQQRRFMLLVKNAFADPRTFWRLPLHTLGVSPIAAPSSLTLEQWLQLFAQHEADPTNQGMALTEPTNPLLNEVIDPVSQNELNAPHTRFVIARMLELAAGRGKSKADTRQMVGLAAPQIGVNKRIIIVDVTATGANQKQTLQVFINPVITKRSAKTVPGREGCWSCGNICGVVERAETVTLSAINLSGKPVTMVLQGFAARVAQHETDHLDGIRFPDRITNDAKLHWVTPEQFPQYRKQWATWPHLCSRSRWLVLKSGHKNY